MDNAKKYLLEGQNLHGAQDVFVHIMGTDRVYLGRPNSASLIELPEKLKYVFPQIRIKGFDEHGILSIELW